MTPSCSSAEVELGLYRCSPLVLQLRNAIEALESFDRQLEALHDGAHLNAASSVSAVLKEVHALCDRGRAIAARSLGRQPSSYGTVDELTSHAASPDSAAGSGAGSEGSPKTSVWTSKGFADVAEASELSLVKVAVPEPSGSGGPAQRTPPLSSPDGDRATNDWSLEVVVRCTMLFFDRLISLLAWAWAFIIPYGVGFGMGPGAGGSMQKASISVCAIFGAHAVASFFIVPYAPPQKIHYADPRTGGVFNPHVRGKYGLWNLLLDFFSIVPLDFCFERPINDLGDRLGWARSKTQYAVSLPAMFMMLRLCKARRLGEGIRRSMLSGIQILLEISLVCHIFACGVSFTTVLPFLGEHGERDGAATFWATLPPPFPVWTGNASDAITDPVLPHYVAPESRYIAALYYACWNVLCVGMGDCKGLLDSERLLTAIMELVGAFIIAYASAYISSVIQQSSGRKHRLDRRSSALTMWIEEAGLPPDLVDRLVADCEVSDDSPAALVGKVVDDVSKSLARQARRSIAEKSVGKMKLLSQLFACHFDTAWRILVELRMSQVPAGEPVLRQGHPCKEIVFLLQGSVNIVCTAGNRPQLYVLGSATSGHVLGLYAGLNLESGEVNLATALSTSCNTLIFVLTSSTLVAILRDADAPFRQLLDAQAEQEQLMMEAALSELNDALHEPTVSSAQGVRQNSTRGLPRLMTATVASAVRMSTNEPWAKLIVANVIWEGAFVPLSEVPHNDMAFVSTLPQHIANARMKLRLTSRYPPAQGSGVKAWLGNFFGLHKKDDKKVLDEESDKELLIRGILSPDGVIRAILNYAMGIAVIYTCITVPINIGFNLEESDTSALIGRVIDALFFFDILITFRTARFIEADSGFRGEGRLNTVPWEIFVAYLRGGLFLDLISTLPFDAMAEASAARLTRVIRLVRLTRLLKLGRVAKLSRMLPSLNRLIVRHPSQFNVAKQLVQMTFLMHLMGCAFVFVITTVEDDPMRAWWGGFIYDVNGNLKLNPEHGRQVNNTLVGNTTVAVYDTPFGTRYLAAIYWAASTATTTGVGDISPATDEERALNALAIIVGVVVMQTMMSRMAGLLTQGVTTATRDILAQADSACRETGLSAELRRSINAYYRSRVSFTSPFDWRGLISNVPFTLQVDVLVWLHADCPVPAAITGQVWQPNNNKYIDGQLIYDVSLVTRPHWAEKGEAIAFKDDVVEDVIILETPQRARMAPTYSPGSLIGRGFRRSRLPPGGESSLAGEARPYEVFGLPLPTDGTRWSEDFIVKRLCFYWTIPISAVRKLSSRYPEVAASAGLTVRDSDLPEPITPMPSLRTSAMGTECANGCYVYAHSPHGTPGRAPLLGPPSHGKQRRLPPPPPPQQQHHAEVESALMADPKAPYQGSLTDGLPVLGERRSVTRLVPVVQRAPVVQRLFESELGAGIDGFVPVSGNPTSEEQDLGESPMKPIYDEVSGYYTLRAARRTIRYQAPLQPSQPQAIAEVDRRETELQPMSYLVLKQQVGLSGMRPATLPGNNGRGGTQLRLAGAQSGLHEPTAWV